MKVLATFTSWLLSNHTTKMTKVSIEINGNLQFSQISHGETFKNLHNIVDVDTLLTQINIIE